MAHRLMIVAAAAAGLAACDPPEMPMPPPLGSEAQSPPSTYFPAKEQKRETAPRSSNGAAQYF